MPVKLYISKIPEELDVGILPQLSEYRKKKLTNASSEKLMKQSIAAELLLEKAVEGLYSRPLPIETTEKGKPYLERNKLFFSVSHSGDFVACAVCDTELGLDIQTEHVCDMKLAGRYFTSDECLYLQNNEKSFTEIWVKKESRLKALGTGLSGGLNSFSVFDKPWEYYYGSTGDLHVSVCLPDVKDFEVNMIEIKLL